MTVGMGGAVLPATMDWPAGVARPEDRERLARYAEALAFYQGEQVRALSPQAGDVPDRPGSPWPSDFSGGHRDACTDAKRRSSGSAGPGSAVLSRPAVLPVQATPVWSADTRA